MTTGLPRQVSLKLAVIVREGASRWRLACGTRAWGSLSFFEVGRPLAQE
jgi:hypothetical protein